jgi:hypothetical protein
MRRALCWNQKVVCALRGVPRYPHPLLMAAWALRHDPHVIAEQFSTAPRAMMSNEFVENR